MQIQLPKAARATRATGVVLSIGALTLSLAAAPAFADREHVHKFNSSSLEIRNLIGEVRVESGGSQFEVVVDVQGADATDGLIEIRTDDGARPSLYVVFPNERRYVYPRLGAGSRSKISVRDRGSSSWLGEVLRSLSGRSDIEVRGSGSGLEVWADVTVRVPASGELRVTHGVGEIFAEDVRGNLDLSTRSGAVEASDIDGDLLIDTGSGHVVAEGVRGDFKADTGSGHVNARDIEGEVYIDTGSGRVELTDAKATDLEIDTGSGGVVAKGVSADSVSIDTGSGGVRLELDYLGNGDISIDTGSGGIDLILPSDASVDVTAETGSGGIRLDLGEVRIKRQARDEVIFTLGGGRSRVDLDTGSGGIRISH